MFSKILLGFLAGITLGILMAPEKESKPARAIGESSDDLKQKFSDLVDQVSHKLHFDEEY